MEVEKFTEKRIYTIYYKAIREILGLDNSWTVEQVQDRNDKLSVTVSRQVDRAVAKPATSSETV